MAITDERPKRRGARGRPSIKHKDHAGKPLAGHEERLKTYIKRTVQLRREGKHFYEIAQMVADEFQLERVPSISAVAYWNKQGSDALTEDIIELQTQTRIDKFIQCEKMLEKWLPIAMADSYMIKRWQMVEGEMQPVIDENAYDEQIKAAKICKDLIETQSKLFNLNLAKEEKITGEGPQTPQELHLWLVNHISGSAKPVHGTVIEGEVVPQADKVLELSSGIEEIDGDGNAV